MDVLNIKKEPMDNKKNLWEVRYMTDYPYSDTMQVEGSTEAEAWEEFERRYGYPRNEYCSIKQLTR